MKARTKPLLRIGGALLLSVPAVWQLLCFARIVGSRLSYPMDLEWMEGGVLYIAERLSHGEAIYTSPDAGFLPFPYAPAHFAILAIVGKIVGLDYWSGRLLSLAALTVASALVAIAAARSWQSSILRYPASLLVVGWVVAGYPLVGDSFDLIRVDPVALCFVTAAAFLATARPLPVRRALFVAALLTGAVFTKQSMAIFAGWICLFVLLRDRRRGIVVGAATALFCAIVLAALQVSSHGRFWFYTVTMLSKHGVEPARMAEAALLTFGFAPFLALVPIGLVVLWRKKALDGVTLFWSGMLGCAVATSIIGYAKATAWLNNLTYAVFFAAPVTLIVAAAVVRTLPVRARPWTAAGIVTVLAALLGLARYDPAPLTVSPELRARAVALNGFIAGLDGPVVVPVSPFLAIRNGRGAPSFHPMAYFDAFGGGVPTPGLFDYLKSGNAKYLITGSCLELPEYEYFVARDLDELYVYDRRLPEGARDIHMLTGFDCPLREVFRLREHPQATAHHGALPEPSDKSTGDLHATEIAIGSAYPVSSHTCARSGDRVSCWGSNDRGQVLPKDPRATIDRPVRVRSGVRRIAAGGVATCALLAEGAAECWGDNREGGLGDGTNAPRDDLTRVKSDRPLTSIAVGGYHACAIDDAAHVHCWGRNSSGQLGTGAASAWGAPAEVPALADVAEIALGTSHTCARTTAGVVTCWGDNSGGQLGDGTLLDRFSPNLVRLPAPARAITAGDDDGCAILEDGRLICWGSNRRGELGTGGIELDSVPVEIHGITAIQSIALAGRHGCARDAAGQVLCWGANDSGEASTSFDQPLSPRVFAELAGASSVALGSEMGCAITKDGAVTCFGRNDRGQLGLGWWNLFGRTAPTLVPAP